MSIQIVTLEIYKSGFEKVMYGVDLEEEKKLPESVMMKKTRINMSAPVSRRVKEKRQMSPIIFLLRPDEYVFSDVLSDQISIYSQVPQMISFFNRSNRCFFSYVFCSRPDPQLYSCLIFFHIHSS